MYANLRTLIFTFTLNFFILGANRLQTNCKQTAKKGKASSASPLLQQIKKTTLNPYHHKTFFILLV